jgi:hypothetical protein
MVMIGAEITRFQRRLRVIAWLCKVLSSDRSGVPFMSWSHTNAREKEGAVKPETAAKRFTVHNRKVTRNGNAGVWDFHVNFCQRRGTKTRSYEMKA